MVSFIAYFKLLDGQVRTCIVLFYNSYIHTIINLLINKHPFIGGKNIFKRKWKERNNVNFCLLVKLFVLYVHVHVPVHPYVRVEN